MLDEIVLVVDGDEGKDRFSIAEFLAQYGADPCYCHPPLLPGDGYVFYNYSGSGDNLEYLAEQLIPAIGRQLESSRVSEVDRDCFEQIRNFTRKKIAAIGGGQLVASANERYIDHNDKRIAYTQIRAAMHDEPFVMSLKSNDYQACARAINQGIDGHLEACFSPSRGDRQNGRKFVISIESMPVLVRRLLEGDDKMVSLGETMLAALGFRS